MIEHKILVKHREQHHRCGDSPLRQGAVSPSSTTSCLGSQSWGVRHIPVSELPQLLPPLFWGTEVGAVGLKFKQVQSLLQQTQSCRKALEKKCFFKLVLNFSNVSAFLTSSGRSFQISGAATLKALWPYRFENRFLTSSFFDADRRLRAGCYFWIVSAK